MPDVRFVSCAEAPRFELLSQAAVCNGVVYLAGVVGMPPGGPVCEGVEAQARQAFRNMRALLGAAGSGLERLISLTVYLSERLSAEEEAAFNRVYAEEFPGGPGQPRPLRCCVRVGLQEGFALELASAVAAQK